MALLVFAVASTNASKAQETLGIAAVVNEDVISLFDLQSRIDLLIATSNQKNTPENRRRHARQVLNQLINEKLQIQEAKRLGIKVSDKEVNRAFATIARRSKMTPKKLTEYLAQINVDKDVLMNKLRAQIGWGRTVNQLFRSEISIGSEEIDDIINEISKSKGKPEYLVAEIFLAIDKPENAGEFRKVADNIISQLKAGADFSVLARNLSQSASAAVGGDLGWIRQGQLAPKLDKAIANMADGSLSPPLQTLSGFHILLKRKSRIGQGLTSDDEKVDLFQVYLPLPPSATADDVKAGLDAAAKMTAGATSCDAMADIAKKTGSKLSGRLGKVKTASLPAQTRKLVGDLAINKPSQPIRSGDGVAVLMVCGREGKLTLSQIRDNIETSLLNDRLDILARRHLRDLRRTAFLDIRI